MTRADPAEATTPKTTDASLLGVGRRRTGLSVRTRIVVSLAVLVAAALTVAGVIIYVLETARLEASAIDQAEQELAEFSTMQSIEQFGDIDDVLRAFMERNVPSDNEMFIGWIDGEPKYGFSQRHRDLINDTGFRADVAALTGPGGSAKVSSPVGDLLLTVQPVSESQLDGTNAENQARAGALVVVSFLEDGRTELHSLMRTYAIVSLLSLGAITLVAMWQAGRLLAPLRRLNDAAREIGSGDLSRRIPETGNDDITALTATVNDMLGRLDGSFTSQRRFLDDAGHELRTPLTVLRGHLELLESGNPSEVTETRELLLDEVDRMSRLVGDMILLAKSNRPDFLRIANVDVDQLTRTAFAKAGALGERSWQLDATADITVRVDRQRLTQALLQLADNAVKHTDRGSEIGIGSAVEGGLVRIWVRDTGDGVPLADQALIFERFGRGPVRPGDEGFGLGLSIVKAIAEAHGGTVKVTDAVPHGALFSINLPLGDTWPGS
jgi:two-component system, OmpR family, sensor kinase